MLNKGLPGVKSVQCLTGAAIGGIIGSMIAILYKSFIINILEFVGIFTITSIDPIIIGTILGAIIGMIIIKIIVQKRICKKRTEKILKKISHNKSDDINMQLCKEQVEISKDKIQTGEVSVHKEIITEEKNITVPVKREEIVVESNVLDGQFRNKSDVSTKIIRIPISKECVDIYKHPVILEDVSVNNHKYEDVKHLTNILKEERLHIATRGDTKIVNKKVDNES